MVQVKVNDGILNGELCDNEYGDQYYSFKGIPYAEPPVGKLRFKAPQPIRPWSGIRNAQNFGPISFQREYGRGPIVGSEDCLYLNVYSPDVSPKSPLPVMVWIHGGGLYWGSGNDCTYGPEYLIRHGVILVTFNYRLGVLGFLCLDTEDVPGNAGMKDQVMALKWVKNNIQHFGGDSNNITIFGESAGGASVSYHLVSPMTKGLFNRGIAQSGSCLNFWVSTTEPRLTAQVLAAKLGLHSENDKELYNFFVNQPVENFVDIQLQVSLASKPYKLAFCIVSEKQFENSDRFFNGDVYDKLKEGIHEGVDFMTGYTEDEGLFAFHLFNRDLQSFYDRMNTYLECYVPNQITIERSLKEKFEVGKLVKAHYLQKCMNCKDNLNGLLKFINMDFFVYELVASAKFIASKKKNKVYLYKFTCKSERNQFVKTFEVDKIFTERTMVCHGEDLLYLFPGKDMTAKVDKDSETFKIINNVTTLWTNFAKYGEPTPDGSLNVKWAPYDLDAQNYLEIGNRLKAGSFPDKEDIELWDSLFKKYVPRCTV